MNKDLCFNGKLKGKISLGTICVDITTNKTDFVGTKYSYINTQSGRHFNYQRQRSEDICIEDIATALSHECRFAGHTDHFYSVAQHSVLVSEMLPPELALEGLLHDAMEAYFKDIPTPLKSLMPGYKKLDGLAPLEDPIIPLLPAQARAKFMARFNELTAATK